MFIPRSVPSIPASTTQMLTTNWDVLLSLVDELNTDFTGVRQEVKEAIPDENSRERSRVNFPGRHHAA